MYNDNKYDTIYNEIQCKIEYNGQYDTIYNQNNMIQWTIWYNVQYSIIAYNITIQYNRQLVQYQTIDNIIQCTMITIWYNIQWIQYTM